MFLLQASVSVQEEWWFKFFLYPSFRVTFLSNSKNIPTIGKVKKSEEQTKKWRNMQRNGEMERKQWW